MCVVVLIGAGVQANIGAAGAGTGGIAAAKTGRRMLVTILLIYSPQFYQISTHCKMYNHFCHNAQSPLRPASPWRYFVVWPHYD